MGEYAVKAAAISVPGSPPSPMKIVKYIIHVSFLRVRESRGRKKPLKTVDGEYITSNMDFGTLNIENWTSWIATRTWILNIERVVIAT